MVEQIHKTPLGNIHYWINTIERDRITIFKEGAF